MRPRSWRVETDRDLYGWKKPDRFWGKTNYRNSLQQPNYSSLWLLRRGTPQCRWRGVDYTEDTWLLGELQWTEFFPTTAIRSINAEVVVAGPILRHPLPPLFTSRTGTARGQRAVSTVEESPTSRLRFLLEQESQKRRKIYYRSTVQACRSSLPTQVARIKETGF